MQEGLIENLVDKSELYKLVPFQKSVWRKKHESDRYDQNNGTQCKKQKIKVKANYEIDFLFLYLKLLDHLQVQNYDRDLFP